MSIIFIIFIILVLLILFIKIFTRKKSVDYSNSNGSVMSRLSKFGAECCNKLRGKNHGI